MKLTVFNAENTPKNDIRNGKPKIGFGKNGCISLNKRACELIQLSIGDKIAIAQDQEDAASWYLFKSEEGFALRGKEVDKTFSLTFNHTSLRNIFFEAFALDVNETMQFELGKEPLEIKNGKITTQYWYIKVPVEETTEVD